MEKKISKKLMLLLSVVITLALILPQATNAQGKANFAGNWTLNAAKSDQPAQPAGGGGGGGGGGQRMGGGAGPFTVTQEGNVLTRVSTRTGQDGTPTTTTLKYTLDGKESVNTNPRGESKSTATYSADGKSLTIVTKSSFNGNEMVSTEAWTLTDASTLTIVSTRNGMDGAPVKTTRVYDKK